MGVSWVGAVVAYLIAVAIFAVVFAVACIPGRRHERAMEARAARVALRADRFRDLNERGR
jgi:hypothetical protein